LGGYLYHLNLIPDLKLKEEDVQARLFRNGECIEQISDPDKTIFLAIDALVNKGLDPEHNKIKSNLFDFFRTQNQVNVKEWTKRILLETERLKKISFDKWKFKDLAGEQIELYLESFRDKSGNPLSTTGLILEGDNLIATSNSKLKIRWK